MPPTDVTSADDLVPDNFDRLAGGFVEAYDWVQWGGMWTGRVTEVCENFCRVQSALWKHDLGLWVVTAQSQTMRVQYDAIDRVIHTGKIQFTLGVQDGLPSETA